MDKNTITGLVLIGLLLIGFTYFSRPSEEQQLAAKRYNDSIAIVQKQAADLKAQQDAALAGERTARINTDSTSVFFTATQGTEQFTTIENEVMKLTLTNKGGRVYTVQLKDYKNQNKQEVELFGGKDAAMDFFFYNQKEIIRTQDLYFTAVEQTDHSVTMRLNASADSYIDFVYTLKPDSYMADFNIHAVGMSRLLANTPYVDIEWNEKARRQERGTQYENRLSNLQYKYAGKNDTDHLSDSRDDQKSVPERLHWIAFKNQFFSAVMIADKYFEKTELTSKVEGDENIYVKAYGAKMNTFFDPTGEEPTQLHFYFGPNHYKTLTALDAGRTDKLDLDNLVYLGWPILRWINQWFTINIFDWFTGMGLSMGIVLLLMTIIVKIVIFPATWKMYISSAKMRVLKPEIDKINAKYPSQDDAMKKQQEIMGLYSQYGVSPMGGCVPMLLQFPIIMALFTFVPSAIELRGQSFLWAQDLSTYDDIIKLPFNIPFLGTHLSLFCLLMTVTTIINAKITMQQQDTGANPQMAAMKWMQYLMPIMFLFILNSYPAGLNYYYFISTLIGIVTMFVLKKTTNESKLLAGLEAQREKNKLKQKKTGGFAARLEAMQKEQERIAKERANRKR